MLIACPRCQQKIESQDNPFKPFCSERCKLIDLGQWANETHKLSTPITSFDDIQLDE